eukprot:sb/3473950/
MTSSAEYECRLEYLQRYMTIKVPIDIIGVPPGISEPKVISGGVGEDLVFVWTPAENDDVNNNYFKEYEISVTRRSRAEYLPDQTEILSRNSRVNNITLPGKDVIPYSKITLTVKTIYEDGEGPATVKSHLTEEIVSPLPPQLQV